jgi:uncharacterized protein YfeS
MKFHVMVRTYNTYGGHPTLSLISDFLLWGVDGFGSAISELTVIFHFPHTRRARITLEQMYADFHANRRSLPKVVFRRQRGQASIDIASELLDGKNWEQGPGLSLQLFKAGVTETVAALELLKKRLTAKDDFNLSAFLAHCSKAHSRLPSTVEELVALAAEYKKNQAARYAVMSPWERLGIDWRVFHPDARSILDDPFFWESSNDFAPNGNDTGADLLADYRKWLLRNPAGDPMTFFRELIRKWGFLPNPSSDDGRTVTDEAAVALAFADFKLRADCSPSVAALARAAIRRQRQHAIEAIDWSHRNERLRSLDMLEAKLPASGG